MSTSRSDFYVAMSGLLSICDEQLLTDVLPLEDLKNINSRILRKGIAVSSFAMLESYLRHSFKHMMSSVSLTQIKYSDFDEKLKSFLSVNAIEGLATYLYFIKDKSKKLAIVDDHVKELSSYLSNPPIYTALGFSPRGSNVAADDVRVAFNAVGVVDPWAKLELIVRACGASTLNLRNDFEALSNARHSSAHHTVDNIPTEDLKSHLRAAVVIGMAVDILAKHAGTALEHCTKASEIAAAINRPIGPFRFLDEETSGSWVERASLTGRGIKRYAALEAGKSGAVGRAIKRYLIVRDRSGLPVELLI